MYSRHGAMKRLGLSTTSHVEPKMTQNEWMAAYGTSNNLRQPRNLLRRPPPPPASRLSRTPSSQAALSAMVAAAQSIPRPPFPSPQRGPRRREEAKEEENSDDEAAFNSDDDLDDDDPRPVGGVEREARADRRLAELRKRHKAEQGKAGRREKTKRTRTLKRSTSDVEIPLPSPASSAPSSPTSAAPDAPSLPTLGRAAVGDVRERTRLLLREALLKMDPDADPATASSSSVSTSNPAPAPSASTGRSKKRKAVDEEAGAEEAEDEAEDAHSLLASDIEQELFELHSSSPSKDYRQHSRDLVFSLVHNPSLTPELTSLRLSPGELVRLGKEALANRAVAKAREMEKQEMNRDAVLEAASGARSDEWLCKGCGHRDTETFTLKEGRDLRKAEVWGGGGDDVHSIILVRCMHCKREWKQEV